MQLPDPDKIVLVTTSGGHQFFAKHSFGIVIDENEEPCWSWCASDVDEHPNCWDDGICWQSNSAGKPSDPVVSWQPANS